MGWWKRLLGFLNGSGCYRTSSCTIYIHTMYYNRFILYSIDLNVSSMPKHWIFEDCKSNQS